MMIWRIKRENIFYTCCLVQIVLCSVVIDSRGYKNVVSYSLNSRLDLDTTSHPRSYKLQWLNDCGELKVFKQVKVLSPYGKRNLHLLKDEGWSIVWCGIHALQVTCSLESLGNLIGRLSMIHGFLNHYTFTHNGRKMYFYPFLPLKKSLFMKKIGKKKR